MAEFAGAVGTISACMSIISAIGNTAKTLKDLRTKIKEAQQSITLMLQRLTTIEIALEHIQKWVNIDWFDKPAQAPLRECITIAMEGCRELMDALYQDVQKLEGSVVGIIGSTRYIWNHSTMKIHEDRLKLHVDHLLFLVEIVKCTNLPARTKLIRSKEYESIRHEVVEDTSSLRSIVTPAGSDAFSISTGRLSVANSDMHTIDALCRESGPYQRVMANAEMQRSDSARSPKQPSTQHMDEMMKRRTSLGLPKLNTQQAQVQRHFSRHATSSWKKSPTDEGYHSKTATPVSCERPSAFTWSPSSIRKPKEYFTHQRDQNGRRNANVSPYPERSPSSVKTSSPVETEPKGFLKKLPSFSFGKNTLNNPKSSKVTKPTSGSDLQGPSSRALRSPDQSNGLVPLLKRFQSIKLDSREGGHIPKLVKAAQEGSEMEVARLLAKGADIEEAHLDSGRTALAVAAHCGHTQIVERLLEHQARHDNWDNDKSSPLHLAASEGHCDIVMLLIAYGAKVEERDAENRTALWLTASNGHIAVVELLLTKRAKVNIRAKNQRSLLHQVASQGHQSIVELLLRHGADIDAKDSNSMTAIHYACHEGHDAVVELLIANGAGRDSAGAGSQTPLIVAAAAGQHQVVQLLLKRKVNVKTKDENQMNALLWACQNGHSDVASCLLSKKLSPNSANAQDQTSLHLAVIYQHFDVVELLLRRHVEIDSKCNKGYTPLHYACANDDTHIIRILIDSGADKEAMTSLQQARPLHVAVSNQNLEAISLLLEYNIQLDSFDVDGNSPLTLACFHGSLQIVEQLAQAGSLLQGTHLDPNNKKLQYSALCTAACQGNTEMCALLITLGADINKSNENFWTPLRFAIYHGHVEVVELLLLHGAETSLGLYRDWSLDLITSEFGFREEPPIPERTRSLILQTIQQFAESVSRPSSTLAATTSPAASEFDLNTITVADTCDSINNRDGCTATTLSPIFELDAVDTESYELDIGVNEQDPLTGTEPMTVFYPHCPAPLLPSAGQQVPTVLDRLSGSSSTSSWQEPRIMQQVSLQQEQQQIQRQSQVQPLPSLALGRQNLSDTNPFRTRTGPNISEPSPPNKTIQSEWSWLNDSSISPDQRSSSPESFIIGDDARFTATPPTTRRSFVVDDD